MEPFTRVTAAGVPLDLPNVDTDRVIPAAPLKVTLPAKVPVDVGLKRTVTRWLWPVTRE